jgi:hypothetical protein
MTKGRVAVGKIESWLPEFESSGKKARQKGTGAWQTATAPARNIEGIWVLKSSIYSEFGSQSRIV